MGSKLVIEGNAVYELDEACLRRKGIRREVGEQPDTGATGEFPENHRIKGKAPVNREPESR